MFLFVTKLWSNAFGVVFETRTLLKSGIPEAYTQPRRWLRRQFVQREAAVSFRGAEHVPPGNDGSALLHIWALRFFASLHRVGLVPLKGGL